MFIPEEQWLNGPNLDVFCYFREPVLNTAGAERQAAILKALGIEGPWAKPEEVGRPELAKAGWVSWPVTYGLWHLGREVVVGAKIIPDIRKAGYELLLAIPPREAERWLGHYPWALGEQWVTKRVIQLHREVIARCRALNLVGELRAVMIQDEAWTFSVPEDAKGICLHPEVAAALGFGGEQRERMFVVPW